MADSSDTRKERRATARAERDRVAEAAKTRRQRLWILGGVLGLAVVIVAIIAIASSGGDDKPTAKKGEIIPGQIETNARFAGIPQRGITVGNPNAPVTLVEFADLQCPFCRNYSTTVMPTIVERYVRSGKLKMEFRNVSFIGNDSLRAAQMAGAASLQNKLWQYIDLFYLNQEEENSNYVTDEFLTRIGRAVRGLDVQQAMDDRALPSVQRALTEAQTEWTVAGFQGTPAFLLGPTGGRLEAMLGEQVAPTVDNVSQAIEARLTAAR
jgi:protein-disulfide isomerase